jgi:hypothetical protein
LCYSVDENELEEKNFMNIKLLASDLDGTLLQNGALLPSPKAYELIGQLKEKGIIFVAASGRQYHSLRKLFAPVADEIAYVCENGSLVMYKNEILYKAEMDENLVTKMLQVIEEHPNYQAVPSTAKGTYVSDRYHEIATLMRNSYNYQIEEIPDIFNLPEPAIKISVYCESGMTQKDDDFFKSLFGEEAMIATSGITWLDMMAKGINKSVGLRELANHLGIAIEDCMAVGDHYNDYEMLQTVGHPVAVENAQAGILEICSQKTDNVENLMRTLL